MIFMLLIAMGSQKVEGLPQIILACPFC
uniref:Pls1 n=1 Tax=Arundo donax TaxID=35708 RepID=A0A0A9F9N8_ARUDO